MNAVPSPLRHILFLLALLILLVAPAAPTFAQADNQRAEAAGGGCTINVVSGNLRINRDYITNFAECIITGPHTILTLTTANFAMSADNTVFSIDGVQIRTLLSTHRGIVLTNNSNGDIRDTSLLMGSASNPATTAIGIGATINSQATVDNVFMDRWYRAISVSNGNLTVTDSIIEDNLNSAIFLTNSSAAQTITIARTTLRNIGVHGIHVSTANNATITLQNNLLRNIAQRGILVDSASNGINIHNNTLRNNLGGNILQVTNANGLARIVNNIVTDSFAGIQVDDPLGVAEYGNNFYFANTSNGNISDPSDVLADPLFQADGYHITNTSPAANAGRTVAGLTDDIDGLPRPTGGAFDIGADESDAPAVVLEVEMSASPTASADALHLVWETGLEIDNLGFHVLRASTPDESAATRQNEALIPSQAPGGQGASYEWLDSNVEPGGTYFYWLEAVATDGSTSRHGPASATLPATSAVTLASLGAAAGTPWLSGILLGGSALLLLGLRLAGKRAQRGR